MVKLFIVFISSIFFLYFPSLALAIYNPLESVNNKIGIHILFPEEVNLAARLVNKNGEGAWGYVVIPIQSIDRNRDKWQKFLSECQNLKLIPIIRVATFPDSNKWAEPQNEDLVDFANFLADLKWPIINRYVVIFNEVNRADEYGGYVNPEAYAHILSNAITTFKERSENFFVLPAGLDNAASNTKESLHWDTYLYRMYKAVPDIFTRIDGWTSHAYPNPEFAAPPQSSGPNKINSFLFDIQYLRRLGLKNNIPIFITETGWNMHKLPPELVAKYFTYAFSRVWSNPHIVTVAPFLLKAHNSPYASFSLLESDNSTTPAYQSIQAFVAAGLPQLDLAPSTANIMGENQNHPPIPLAPQEYKPDILKKILDIIFNFF